MPTNTSICIESGLFDSEHPGSKVVMNLLTRDAYRYLLGVLSILVAYLPTLRVPVMGDDFYLQYQATGQTGGDFLLWQASNLNGAITNGHFKPIGNALDSIPQFLVYPLSAFFGVSTRYFYFTQGFLLFILVVVAATWFARVAMRVFAQADIPRAKIFLAIAVVAGISIQIHPWSNDPVTTYLATGMVSAVLSFVILGLTLRAVENSSKGLSNQFAWLSAIGGIVGVLQYEMNLAAIAGSGFLIVFYFWADSLTRFVLDKRLWISLFTSVLIPGSVFLIGRFISAVSSPESDGYTGTQFAFSLLGVQTLMFALTSNLPAGAWVTSFQALPTMTIHWQLIVLFFASALTSTLAMIELCRGSEKRIRLSALVGPAISLGIVGVLASASHAFTPKYQIEINAPGKVYLSYMIGAMSINVVIATSMFALVGAGALNNLSKVLVVTSLVVSFGLAQQAINWGLGSLSSSAYSNNAAMSIATTSRTMPEIERCQVLQNWASQGWPDYYLQGVIEYSSAAYELFYNEEFCPTFSK